jgi:1L-myo-inositol 1-phosphate cytidylyltransferase
VTKRIRDAVILLAGSGSRFRAKGETRFKPLLLFFERPLISHTLEALLNADIERIHIVVGFEAKAMRAAIEPLIPSSLNVSWIDNPEWQKQNGISVLAAAPHVTAPFLLTMGDHLFEQSIVDLLIRNADLNALNVAVDRKLDTIFDPADAMKVKTKRNRVIAIGKNLTDYNAIDTGLFVCSLEFFQYLERAKRNGDCSLADGVQAMASDGKVNAIDIGPARWHDIDTPEMLRDAEGRFRQNK